MVVRIISRLLEIGLIAIGSAFIFNVSGRELQWMATWDVLAIIYLAIIGFGLSRTLTRPDTAIGGFESLAGAFAVGASLVGIVAAIVAGIAKNTPDITEDEQNAYALIAAVAMIASWAVMQIGFARMYRAADTTFGGLSFPKTKQPGPIEYAYFAFTVGSSFATSDVEVTNSQLRWRVLIHSGWSFFYNVGIIAMAFGLLTGGK